jgi:hypothetical protein
MTTDLRGGGGAGVEDVRLGGGAGAAGAVSLAGRAVTTLSSFTSLDDSDGFSGVTGTGTGAGSAALNGLG